VKNVKTCGQFFEPLYAKCIILPLLGLINSYDEPEIQEPGTQNKGKEYAIEMEDDMWQEAGLWINQHESSEYDEYESNEEIEQDEEFLN
jgi:hypothetical protein